MSEFKHSSSGRLRVLILEDNARDVEFGLIELKKTGLEVHSDVVDTAEAFEEKLAAGNYDLILSDYRLPLWSGVEAFHLVRQRGLDIPFILVTGTLGEEAAVDLIKEGIADYILKDRLARLPSAIHRALKDKKTRDERESAMRALTRSEARVRRLVESSIIGIAIADFSGKLVEANGACARLLGYTKEELLSGETSWSTLTPAEFHESDQRKLEQLKATGIATPWEKQFVRKDGSRISALIGMTALAAADGDTEFVSFILDISERKQLEQQLRQAQKMEAIGQLAGGIAHDFNNLLGVIIGYSEILVDRAGEDVKMRSQCQEIKKAGDRAASLTRQLLAFSRQQVLAPKILNVNSVVVETEKMLRRLIGEDIELQTRLDNGLSSTKADPGQIEQVIMNLAVNARDAMPEGGKLVIETKSVELDERYAFLHPPCEAGKYVLLTVTDTGFGMNEETKTHIFEPFFTTKEPGKGTGLGLATVYGVVKQTGGFIVVESEPGKGASFRIYLPCVDRPAEQSRSSEAPAKLARGNETVLLVEDEEAVRTLTRTMLETGGYRVLEAGSGNEALEVASKEPGPIQLLVTDVIMPGMNGRALAQKMIGIRPEIKVLFVSGYTGNFGSCGELVREGAKLLPKPFTRKELLENLRELLETSAVLE